MRVCLYLDPSRFLRWHRWLADALFDTPGCRTSFAFSKVAHPLPGACAMALELERLIYGLGADHAIDQLGAPDEDIRSPAGGDEPASFDMVINLAGQTGTLPACDRVLTPLFNSIPGEIGAIAALLDDHPLRIEMHDSARVIEPLCARPAMADPLVLVTALDGVFSRTAELILKAVNEAPDTADTFGRRMASKTETPCVPTLPGAVARVVAVLAGKMIAFIGKMVRGNRSWAVAYRLGDPLALLDKRQARFSLLPDDGHRYYADPFPYCHEGQHFIFVEEFPFASQRGCISVAAVGGDGSITRPRAIIEESHHLSYPFVFEQDGHIWMIPESGEANRIDLYRAEFFPYRWKREGCLVDEIAGYDATLLRQDDRFWLLASMRRWRSTSWDSLSIFHSKRLAGPWVPHSQNPVLLDATRSRPGGAPFERGGDTLLPVQDCSRIYGGAITVNRVDVLSESVFRQTTIGRIECGTLGCHTYNRQAGLEVLDIFDARRGLRDVVASYTSATQGLGRRGSAVAAPAAYGEPT